MSTRKRGKYFFWALGSTLLFYLFILIFVFFQQEELLFFPNTQNINTRTHKEITLEVEQETYGLTNIGSNYCHTQEVILFFHGNAGNIYNQRIYQFFDSNGLCFFAIDYPGYGKSLGQITSIQDLYTQADISFDRATGQGYTPDQIIPRGHSLGGGLASYLANKHSTPKLILASTYTSLQQVMKHHYPFIPKQLLQYNLSTSKALTTYTGNILIIHSTQDRTIPYHHATQNAGFSNTYLITTTGQHNSSLSLQHQSSIINRLH